VKLIVPPAATDAQVRARSRGESCECHSAGREPNRATPLDNVIDVHLAHLRRKLDDGEIVKLIQTVRGVGFVLRAEGDA